jgi:UDP-N-acetylmuramate--alanine ligase
MNNILNIKNQKKSVGLILLNQKIFHIIGIGGIGMSAIASILHEHGLFVQGSDLNFSDNIRRLEEKNIQWVSRLHL